MGGSGSVREWEWSGSGKWEVVRGNSRKERVGGSEKGLEGIGGSGCEGVWMGGKVRYNISIKIGIYLLFS